MSSIPNQDYQQYAQGMQRKQEAKDARTNNRVRIGFLCFFIIDTSLLAIGVVGYLIYTPIHIDPSEAFKIMSWTSGLMLFIGTICYLAWLDLVDKRKENPYR